MAPKIISRNWKAVTSGASATLTTFAALVIVVQVVLSRWLGVDEDPMFYEATAVLIMAAVSLISGLITAIATWWSPKNKDPESITQISSKRISNKERR